jgi:formate C-acetyltransferase
MLDFCDSIGRFDQALGPLFEADLAAGRLDPDLARTLLDEVWLNFERHNGWNLQLGGWTPAGEDGTNALTLECLEACRRNHQRRPNVAFRITSRTPDEALVQALSVLGEGGGRPALYHDDLYVETLHGMDLGLSLEDAREIGFGGCTETMIAGLSNVGSLEGELNLAKALELALHDGFDPVAERQVGPHTGAFEQMAGFDALVAAVKAQIDHLTDTFAASHNEALQRRFTEGDPKLYRTFFTRDCVRRRKSFEAGGARYNWAVVSYQGIANLIDGLAAIRLRVFQEGSVSRGELLEALAADFVGGEAVQRRLATAPRFGNDLDEVDALGAELVRHAWERLYGHRTPRGGRYLPSCILFATYGAAGRQVGATPDGRKAFEPLTDSVGPVQGRDTHGPTAMLRSVAKLPLSLGAGTPVLNIRLQKSLFGTRSGLAAAAALVRGYFAQGGMQIQVSVLDREALLAAQREPEKWGDLIVRIGGYSEYFTRLDRGLQQSVLERTEHGVG